MTTIKILIEDRDIMIFKLKLLDPNQNMIYSIGVKQYLSQIYSMQKGQETEIEFKMRPEDDPSLTQLERVDRRRLIKSPFRARTQNNRNRKTHKQTVRHDKLKLKTLLMKNKSNKLTKNFMNKLRLNTVNRKPVEDIENIGEEKTEKIKENCFLESLSGLAAVKVGNVALTAWTLLNTVHATLMVFVFSVMMAFSSTVDDQLFYYLRLCSIGIYLLDMILNCIVERYEGGKLLSDIHDLLIFYVENLLILDFVSLGIFCIDLAVGEDTALVGTIAALVRLVNHRKKFQKLEYLYISSTEREQYYGLIKVFLTNFAIGHVLSILLNLMAPLSTNNWWLKINITGAEWYIKYIWGYYWGTNIMLTVGFGDLSATNSYEAIILVFIETFSCITLAYNISYVGALIGSIREKEEEKKKKLKFFHKMCQENQIPQELESKITNYIEESYEIKDAFCYEQYDEVIESLPKSMQREYRKEANKIVFDGLGFLNNLSKKTLLKMAELVERQICHPNEYVLRKGNKAQFMILQMGKLCFSCKVNRANSLDGKIMEILSVGDKENPKMISLDFIKNRQLNYDIRSEHYSILYTLSLENFKESLRSSDMDYQLYCLLRDRDECFIDEQNIYPCSLCKDKFHTKFDCSRLHFRPLKQMVIYHYLEKVKKSKAERSDFNRSKGNSPTLLTYYENRSEYKKFASENLGDQQPAFSGKGSTPSLSSLPESRSSKINTMESMGNNVKSLFAANHIIDKLQNMINTNIMEKKFWDIESDEAFNYRFYYQNENPNNILKRKEKTPSYPFDR